MHSLLVPQASAPGGPGEAPSHLLLLEVPRCSPPDSCTAATSAPSRQVGLSPPPLKTHPAGCSVPHVIEDGPLFKSSITYTETSFPNIVTFTDSMDEHLGSGVHCSTLHNT